MDLPPTIFIAIGAVLAAFISGVFTYVNLITSKDQKTSEFRQEWINSLREELSNFIAAVDHIGSLLVYYKESCENHDTLQERYDKVIHDHPDLLTKINSDYSKIKLRVNPEEDKEFLRKLVVVYEIFSEGDIPNSLGEINEKISSLIEEAQTLLKREWERVKTGEPTYRITKYAALLFLSIVLLSGWELYDSFKKPEAATQEQVQEQENPNKSSKCGAVTGAHS